ncbi:hypothetical protein [Flavobacterium sp. NKUCC04_CG]|uniref:hypothetical protein n=1 Tax=Flavobacterium sp. NKUCC04_CG TaxID=2842121 RepID=UPI001C5B7E20|nr:hypothetical protein [Flavobacterium sp. NKUCC04_CG]MBW3519449.1 hypothetical protein [Flavobacterium sp. NKUCC04_CG]
MKDIQKRLNTIQTDGIEISTFKLLSEASKIYPKIALMAGLATLLVGIICSILFSIGLFLYTQEPKVMVSLLTNFDPLFLSFDGLITYTLALSIGTGISAIFSAGFVKMAADAYQDKLVLLTTTFTYFKTKACLQLFAAHFVITLLFTVLSLYLQLQNLQYVALGINWLVSSLTVLVTPLIIFGNLSAFSAIKHSVDIVNKQPLQIIALLLFSSLLAGAGLLLFIVGVIFTLPFIYCVYFILYQNTVGYVDETK